MNGGIENSDFSGDVKLADMTAVYKKYNRNEKADSSV